jgi:hypothetical protein
VNKNHPLYDADFEDETDLTGDPPADVAVVEKATTATATRRKRSEKPERSSAPAEENAGPDAEAGEIVPDQGDGADDGGAPPRALRSELPIARVRNLEIRPFPQFLSVSAEFRTDCLNARDIIHGTASERIEAALAPVAAEHYKTDPDFLQSLEWRKALATMIEDGNAKERELAELSAKVDGASASEYVTLADTRDVAEALVNVKTSRVSELKTKIATLEKASSTRLEKKLRDVLKGLVNESLKESEQLKADLLAVMGPLMLRLAIAERVRARGAMPLTQFLKPPA